MPLPQDVRTQLVRDLRALRDLLTPPERWTIDGDAFAVPFLLHDVISPPPEPLDANAPEAVCWCLTGGIEKVIGLEGTLVRFTRMERRLYVAIAGTKRGQALLASSLADAAAFEDFADAWRLWKIRRANDNATHAEVLAWVDAALFRASLS